MQILMNYQRELAKYDFERGMWHLQAKLRSLQENYYLEEKAKIEAIRYQEEILARIRFREREELVRLRGLSNIDWEQYYLKYLNDKQKCANISHQAPENDANLDKVIKDQQNANPLKKQVQKKNNEKQGYQNLLEQYQRKNKNKKKQAKTEKRYQSFTNDNKQKIINEEEVSNKKINKKKQNTKGKEFPLKNAYFSLNKQQMQSSPKKKNKSFVSNCEQRINMNSTLNISDRISKRIQNRLKLSCVIYKDSQLKNIKHEVDHLINTFDCEVKLRKQIKDKFNNHPKVLKKHAIVIDSR